MVFDTDLEGGLVIIIIKIQETETGMHTERGRERESNREPEKQLQYVLFLFPLIVTESKLT